jgi:uncharacterized damage-inducible protein DinB
MDLLDRFLGHDAWTTRQLLEIASSLSDAQLDRPFDVGHRTLRATLTHIVGNLEVWSALMAGVPIERPTDTSIPGLMRRLDEAAARLRTVARAVADRDGWDEPWIDHLDKPPTEKTYGAAVAHVITHSMHHRAQVLYLLRLSGVKDLPEGDVFSWENRGTTPAVKDP